MRSRPLLIIILLLTPLTWSECVAATDAADQLKGLILHGSCLVFQGPLHAELPFVLYQPSPRQASLAVECPPLLTLPERMLVLKDGESLLHWVEPASARDPLSDGSGILDILSSLQAGQWMQFLLADDLPSLIGVAEAEASLGNYPLMGSLGGHAARLEKPGRRIWSLRLVLEEGSYLLTWRSLPAARRCLLSLETPAGRRLLIRSRFPRRRMLTPEEWLFIDASEEILEPAAGGSVSESFQSGGKR